MQQLADLIFQFSYLSNLLFNQNLCQRRNIILYQIKQEACVCTFVLDALWVLNFAAQKTFICADSIQIYNCLFQHILKGQTKMETEYGNYAITLQNAYETQSSIRQDSNQKCQFDGQQPNAELSKSVKRFKKNLENAQILSLHTKKQNLLRFTDLIGENSFHPIRNDILQHCEKVSINIPSNISKDTVMKLVKNRVEKMIKNKRIKKNWSQQDLKILVWVISKYCQYHGISSVRDGMTAGDWNDIANLIPGVTGKSCMFKWLSLKKNNLADNSWIQQESLLLDQMVKKYGENNWCRVSEELFLKNTLPNKIYRCPKQCREHWNCYLNPQLKKGPWDRKEDYLLVRAVKELEGVKKWAEIVKMFNGRTENALKNRFNLIIEKQIKQLKKYKKPTQLEVIDSYLNKHQNQCQVNEENLKFLSEKRNHYSQIQAKKQPKRSKSKKMKEQKAFSEEDQYVPDQNPWIVPKDRRNCRGRGKQVEQNYYEQKKEEFYCKNESIMASILSGRKNDPIFEYEEQESIKVEERQPEIHHSIWEYKRADMLSIEPISVVPFSNEVINALKRTGTNYIPCILSDTKFLSFINYK